MWTVDEEDGSGGALHSDAAALAAAFAPGTEELRAAVAGCVRRSTDAIVQAVHDATEGRDDAGLTSADRRTAKYRLATHMRRGVDVLAGWIETAAVPTPERLASLAEVGRWVADSAVSFSRVVRADSASRDVLWTVVRLAVLERGASATVAHGLRVAVEQGCDTSLMLVAHQLDDRAKVLAADLAAKDREMAHRALHDPLTGLANRSLLFDRLRQVAQRSRRHPTAARPAVLFVDLDAFKAVNDERGHAAGDAMLRLLARRLTGAVRPEDTVARLGGDEFVVLCESVPDRGWALELAGRVLGVLQAPIVDGEHSTVLTASIGVVVGDQPGWDPDRLLSEADHAMYRAKQQGPGRVHASWLAEQLPGPRQAPPRP